MEKWLPVVSYEGIYEVSDLGRVRRVLTGKGTRGANYVLKQMRDTGGYRQVTLTSGGVQTIYKTHALVMAAFVGKRPNGYEINHLDGHRANNRLDNLEYCTSSENKLHAYSVLNRPPQCSKGVINGRAKLSEDQVRDIRRRYAQGGVSQQALANEYGVTQTMVGFIVRRVSWSHLEDQ